MSAGTYASKSTVKRNSNYVNPYTEYTGLFVYEVTHREARRITEMLHSLLTQNKALGGSDYHFEYRGKNYSPYAASVYPTVKVDPIHPSLEEEAEHVALLHDKLNKDEHYLAQHLKVLLLKCRSMQDVRDVLPDILTQPYAGFADRPRTRPEGFLVAQNALLTAQFKTFQDIVRYYISNRLIYS
jgi:hypothetical protein